MPGDRTVPWISSIAAFPHMWLSRTSGQVIQDSKKGDMTKAKAYENKAGWKQKIRHELVEYWTDVSYLALFFGVFTLCRRTRHMLYGSARG
jgi:hypothetical protein